VLNTRQAQWALAIRRLRENHSQPVLPAQKEKDQLALAQYGDKLLCDRPDPDDPGGLGAEESGIERTGPTQWILLAIQRGSRLAEVGRYYDSANDPVTACFPPDMLTRRFEGT